MGTFCSGWLDTLISERLTAERPNTTLAVICGAVTKAYLQGEASFGEWKRVLSKGQLPPKEFLKTVFQLDFIYEVRASIPMLFIRLVRPTHIIHAGREVSGYRYTLWP
jgi:acetyl-CoA carboxylase / biotin carboxylase 1